jgi:predicted NAD/FAD-dependent oxidoreductase
VDAGEVQLDPADRDSLESIAYAPCLAGMFQIDGRVHLPEPGALQQTDAAISWIADNQRKGISPEATVITIHAGPDYSRWLFEQPDAEALARLEAGLRPFLDPKATIVGSQLKRWRYALPTALHADRCLVAKNLPTLVFCGDAFGGPRVEGAVLSGLVAGEALGREVTMPQAL